MDHILEVLTKNYITDTYDLVVPFHIRLDRFTDGFNGVVTGSGETGTTEIVRSLTRQLPFI